MPCFTSNLSNFLGGVVEQGELYRGFGDSLARAFELTLTPTIFGAGGYALDGWLGTRPAFTIVLALLAVVGLFVRAWYSYDRTMRTHEASGPWAQRQTAAE